jgi:hypothetical protein
LAAGGLRLLTVQIADELPQVREVAVDRWVLGFTFVLSCAGGLLFGLFPVHGARRAGVAGHLRDGARTAGADRRTNKMRNVLVVVEVALAIVMLTSAGLLVRSLAHLRDADTGFDASGVLMGVINLPQSKYPNRDRWDAFNTELLERTRALPGVVDAAFGVGVPFLGVPVPLPIAVEGRHSDRPQGHRRWTEGPCRRDRRSGRRYRADVDCRAPPGAVVHALRPAAVLDHQFCAANTW